MEIKVGTNQDIKIIEEDDGSRTVRIEDKPGVEISTLRPGDTFIIDDHEWIVLDTKFKTDYTYGVGVISKDFYNIMTFGDLKDFSGSNIEIYLKHIVLPKITYNINSEAVPTRVSFYSLDGQREFFEASRHIRLITYDEARKYNQFLVNEAIGYKWWTCTPWSTTERGCDYDMVTIDPSGMISKSNCKKERCGVRPFCVLAPYTIVRIQ